MEGPMLLAEYNGIGVFYGKRGEEKPLFLNKES
jgi:hypothetical protein